MNQLIAGDFHVNLVKISASLYQEIEMEMDFLTPRRLLQKACSYKCQLCTEGRAS